MRILLRHRKTGLYYCNVNQWTDKAETAIDFPQSRQAVALVQARGLTQVELLLAFEDARYNFRLPIRHSR